MDTKTNRLIGPLGLMGIFMTFTEIALSIGLTQTTGIVQAALTIFVIVFPISIAALFFTMLWKKPLHLYAPFEYGSAKDAAIFIDAIQKSSELVQVKAEEVATMAQDIKNLKIELDRKIEEAKEHSISMALTLG